MPNTQCDAKHKCDAYIQNNAMPIYKKCDNVFYTNAMPNTQMDA
jgi:hypothetical protein